MDTLPTRKLAAGHWQILNASYVCVAEAVLDPRYPGRPRALALVHDRRLGRRPVAAEGQRRGRGVSPAVQLTPRPGPGQARATTERNHCMKVHVTIERDDDDPVGESTSMGISASGLQPHEVCVLLMAGAEMTMYDTVLKSLIANGAGEATAEYAAPLRTRMHVVELLITQEPVPYSWVQLDLAPGEG